MEMVQADRIPTAETLGHNENRMPPKTKEPNLLALGLRHTSAHPRFLLNVRSLGKIFGDSTSFGSARDGCRKNLPLGGRNETAVPASWLLLHRLLGVFR